MKRILLLVTLFLGACSNRADIPFCRLEQARVACERGSSYVRSIEIVTGDTGYKVKFICANKLETPWYASHYKCDVEHMKAEDE